MVGASNDGLADGSLNEGAGDGAGVGGLNAWGALVGGLDGDTLARAVLLHGVELLGGVASSVVVVVLVVDVVHVVVVDVGSLEGLVALEVALTAPQDLGLLLGVDLDILSLAARIELVGSWSVRIGLVGVAQGHESVIAVGSWELSHEFSVTWEESLALHNSSDGSVVSGGDDHLVNFVGISELFNVTELLHSSDVSPVDLSSGGLLPALFGFQIADHLFKLVSRDTLFHELLLFP